MKTIYWIKIEVWCAYPFQDEIDRRYIEFHTKVRHNHKTRLDFTCDSSVVGEERLDFVVGKLNETMNISKKNVRLVSILTYNKNKYKKKLKT